jgi:hypothetical protein
MNDASEFEPGEGRAVAADSDNGQVANLAAIIQAAVTPFAQSQETVARETTRQAQIIANSKTVVVKWIGAIAILVLVLAGCALFLGKDQLTEKVIVAILGFLGGVGYGKSTSSRR